MENENKVNKSLEILGEVVKYAEMMCKLINNRPQFSNKKLFKLEDNADPTLRGGAEVHLVLDSNTMKVQYKYSDGFLHIESINTSKPYNTYGYNFNDNLTIELAVKIASNWKRIKENIESSINEHNNAQCNEEEILNSFVV